MSLLPEHNAPEMVARIVSHPCVREVFECIEHFNRYYPDFDAWYWGKVVPELHVGARRIQTVIRDGQIVGLSILKDAGEKKVCTLWVSDRFVGTGMGVRLLASGASLLGGRPVATVPEERMGDLGPVLKRLGFQLTEVLDSYYRVGRKEFVFNGTLRNLAS